MDPKDIRKQVRNVMKEHLAEVMASQVIEAIEKKIVDDVNKKLKAIHDQVEASLKQMDKKVTDGVNYLIRHTGDTPLKIKFDKS